VIDKIQGPGQVQGSASAAKGRPASREKGDFGAMLRDQLDTKGRGTQPVNFSKHALARAEERGIELTPTLMDRLASSVEKAQEKGATNILAFDDSGAFIINIPYGRVITTMSQEEMKENIFTNIDGAVLL
jgi:flagellar operon protein